MTERTELSNIWYLIMIFYGVLFFVLGLSMGSFLNVVVFRIDDLKSIIFERSHCPHCKEILKWYDLVPFLSFVLLRGKCRYCSKAISWQYPIVEIATAFLYLFLFLHFGISWALLYFGLIFSILTVTVVYDIQKQLIPEEFVWVALILALLGGWYFSGSGIYYMLLGGLICGGVPAILVLISKEKWMGAGDIKVGFLAGALVGYPKALLVIFLSFILGSIIGLVMIAIGKKKLKDTLPFAPFLIVSSLIALLWGGFIVDWYFGHLVF